MRRGARSITLAFILSLRMGSIQKDDTHALEIDTVLSSSQEIRDPNFSIIAMRVITSVLCGTLLITTSSSVKRDAGSSLMMLFLFGTGVTVPDRE
jgi:hypothetical protein